MRLSERLVGIGLVRLLETLLGIGDELLRLLLRRSGPLGSLGLDHLGLLASAAEHSILGIEHRDHRVVDGLPGRDLLGLVFSLLQASFGVGRPSFEFAEVRLELSQVIANLAFVVSLARHGKLSTVDVGWRVGKTVAHPACIGSRSGPLDLVPDPYRRRLRESRPAPDQSREALPMSTTSPGRTPRSQPRCFRRDRGRTPGSCAAQPSANSRSRHTRRFDPDGRRAAAVATTRDR